MENEIKGFMDYLAGEKGASKNTQLSYVDFLIISYQSILRLSCA